jgi:uncharacterized protein YndB with AHSA1/START domain
MESYSVKGSIKILAPLAKIWDVLTDPDKIILYTGSKTETDWQPGSQIVWFGEMQGLKYQNKGKVLENKPNRLLKFTYWSGIGGDADLPENHSEILYTLNPMDDHSTELSYSRIKIPTSVEKQIFEQHLPFMLEEIKKLAEG